MYRNLGNAESTNRGDQAALKVFNYFLVNRKSYPKYEDLKSEHVEGEMLKVILGDYATFLANTPIPKYCNDDLQPTTNNPGYLLFTSIISYFSKAKTLLKEKFPMHEDFQPESEMTWWPALYNACEKATERAQFSAEETFGDPKVYPIYLDVTDRNYLNGNTVDLKSICRDKLRKSDLSRSRDILQQRAWLSWTYHAVGRSGEVQFLEFSDTVYDPFFHAAVPLWMEPKTLQKYSQIMVHTKYSCGSYLVDPYHSLGSYWAVEDGLYRSNSNASSTSGFYFPQLHSLRSDRVSSKITAAIRSSIEDKTIAKKYSGRSLRKGSSTELRMHRDISEAETIARSGHATGSNIDKYIDRFNPTLNLPGAMALAGYSECHRIPSPPRFSAIGDYVMEDVQRLIDELFVISVPAMKRGGDLRPFLVSTAASMVMYHCDIKKDFGLHHPIVTKLEDAASKAKITDGASPSPSTTGVLEFWSKKILSDFIAKNDECDLSFGCPDKTMQLLSKVSTLTSTVSNLVSMTQNISSQNVVLQTTLTSFLDVASSLNHHLRDVTTTRRTPTPRKSKNMALYQGIDGDESSFLSELDKELSDDMPTRDPEYVPDETTAAGVQIFDNSQSCDVPNARTINEALQFTAHAADVNKADLKGITIRSLVEQFYSAQLFHHSNSKTGMKNFTLPILQGDSKNRTKILSVVELVEFCTSDAQYQSLKKGDLTREEVKKIADEIELRVLSKINELAGVTKSRRKPLVLGIGTYLRGQMNERKVASLEALFP